jgi:hypothetical protein
LGSRDNPSHSQCISFNVTFFNSSGNILATENQQAIINDVIDVKTGVYLHKY